MKVFNIPYRMTDEDYLKFNDHFIQHTELGKKTLSTYRTLGPIIAGIFFVVVFFLRRDPFLLIAEAIALTAFSLVWFFNARKVLLKSIKKRLRRRGPAADLTLYSAVGEIVFDFESHSITDIDAKTETKIRFENIFACYQTEEAFYFYFQPGRAVILPFRSFTDSEEFSEFVRLVRSEFSFA